MISNQMMVTSMASNDERINIFHRADDRSSRYCACVHGNVGTPTCTAGEQRNDQRSWKDRLLQPQSTRQMPRRWDGTDGSRVAEVTLHHHCTHLGGRDVCRDRHRVVNAGAQTRSVGDWCDQLHVWQSRRRCPDCCGVWLLVAEPTVTGARSRCTHTDSLLSPTRPPTRLADGSISELLLPVTSQGRMRWVLHDRSGLCL